MPKISVFLEEPSIRLDMLSFLQVSGLRRDAGSAVGRRWSERNRATVTAKAGALGMLRIVCMCTRLTLSVRIGMPSFRS